VKRKHRSNQRLNVTPESETAVRWVERVKHLDDVPQSTLCVWDGHDEVIQPFPLVGATALDKQVEFGERILDRHPGAKGLSYRFGEGLTMQFCGGWGKFTLYEKDRRPSACVGDSGPLGRLLWDHQSQFDEYLMSLQNVRSLANDLSASWRPGLHDMPTLHLKHTQSMDRWKSVAVIDADATGLFDAWRRLVKETRPAITCQACENIVTFGDGNSTEKEMFTLTFEMAVIQHPIVFGWMIHDGALHNPFVSLGMRWVRCQLMLDADFR
jgi:hypothetical protein